MTTLSRKKVVFYALLMLAAVVGLLVDRLRFSPASAKGENVAPAPVPSPVSPDRASEGEEIGGPVIASLFRAVTGGPEETSDDPNRDAFAVSPDMEEHYGHTPARRATDGTGDGSTTEETVDIGTFIERHRLQATSVQKNRAWALIDGRVLRMGDNLDGFTLRRIDHYRVTFECDGQSLDLTMPDPRETKVPAPDPR